MHIYINVQIRLSNTVKRDIYYKLSVQAFKPFDYCKLINGEKRYF